MASFLSQSVFRRKILEQGGILQGCSSPVGTFGKKPHEGNHTGSKDSTEGVVFDSGSAHDTFLIYGMNAITGCYGVFFKVFGFRSQILEQGRILQGLGSPGTFGEKPQKDNHTGSKDGTDGMDSIDRVLPDLGSAHEIFLIL